VGAGTQNSKKHHLQTSQAWMAKFTWPYDGMSEMDRATAAALEEIEASRGLFARLPAESISQVELETAK
jgi:hypothetical protein